MADAAGSRAVSREPRGGHASPVRVRRSTARLEARGHWQDSATGGKLATMGRNGTRSDLAADDPAVPALDGFHPAVAGWFTETLGAPTEPQRRGWPAIQQRRHVLIAAPTGTGKTLAAFLWAIDGLLRQGDRLPDATQVLYVSPLRALSTDVQKNLAGPLAAIRARDPSLPEIRVLVRTGDTTSSARAAMGRRPPHI